jgi:hypothetical protein
MLELAKAHRKQDKEAEFFTPEEMKSEKKNTTDSSGCTQKSFLFWRTAQRTERERGGRKAGRKSALRRVYSEGAARVRRN